MIVPTSAKVGIARFYKTKTPPSSKDSSGVFAFGISDHSSTHRNYVSRASRAVPGPEFTLHHPVALRSAIPPLSTTRKQRSHTKALRTALLTCNDVPAPTTPPSTNREQQSTCQRPRFRQQAPAKLHARTRKHLRCDRCKRQLRALSCPILPRSVSHGIRWKWPSFSTKMMARSNRLIRRAA
jgi:hypothetical protein